MENEIRKLQRQMFRTRVGGVLGLGLLGASIGGCIYHMKVMHHEAFSDIYAKHKTKMEESRASGERGPNCPVYRFDWKKYDPREVDWRSKFPGSDKKE